MPRTTVNLDATVLAALKRLQRQERKSLGGLISELVATALEARKRGGDPEPAFSWTAQPMNARVDLEDKEAVRAALGEP